MAPLLFLTVLLVTLLPTAASAQFGQSGGQFAPRIMVRSYGPAVSRYGVRMRSRRVFARSGSIRMHTRGGFVRGYGSYGPYGAMPRYRPYYGPPPRVASRLDTQSKRHWRYGIPKSSEYGASPQLGPSNAPLPVYRPTMSQGGMSSGSREARSDGSAQASGPAGSGAREARSEGSAQTSRLTGSGGAGSGLAGAYSCRTRVGECRFQARRPVERGGTCHCDTDGGGSVEGIVR
jgi:hypothetical protein